jgi:hypothetical protein
MKIVKLLLMVLVPLALIVAVLAPIGPLPGFRIGGEPTPAPAVWPDTSDVHEIKLKVPGTLPRVVIIWVVEHNQELHVVGAADGGWVERLGQGQPVEMRLNDKTYALNAVRQSSNLEAILAAYIEKYKADYPDIVAGFPSMEDAVDSGFDQFAVFTLNRSL